MNLQPTPKDERQVGLTSDDVAEIRRRADDDVFYFGKVICGHRDLVFEDHAPLMYAAAGDAAKLLAILRSETLNSYTILQFRQECVRFDIDLDAPDAQGRLAEHLRVVDLRVYRGSGKSSALTHAVRLWKMVKFPDMSSALITNVDDPKARDFCKQIRATILSDLFAVVYPDRVPADPRLLTENRLTLAGRTIPDKEPCLMVFGHKASPTGYHFDELQFDDLVGRENRSAVEIAEVRDFLSHVADLYNPGIRFTIRRVHVGTRWDEEDDAAYVRAYPKCLSVTIPIWKRDSPSDDIRIPGIPTTQWKPLDACIAKQEEILANPEEGALSWRCNNELDPAVAGGRIFPVDLVDNAKWMPRAMRVLRNGREALVEGVERSQFDAKTGERLPKNRAFDKDSLYKVICCDQAFSESQSADAWAVSCVGMDQYGHRFHLETRTGKGLETMMDAMEMMRIDWKPMRIGMEKIAAQQAIELFLKASTKFQRLYSMVEEVSHRNLVKEYRIRNYVAEIMRMKRFWLNPRDVDTAQEMKKYKPGKNAKDNILDSLAMCEVLIQKSLAPKDEEEDWKSKFRRSNARNQGRRDPRTGVALF